MVLIRHAYRPIAQDFGVKAPDLAAPFFSRSAATDTLLGEIGKFLVRHPSMARTTFGRLAASDARLVEEMRRGREVRPATAAKVRAFMAGREVTP